MREQKWWEFIDYGPVYIPTVVKIPVKQLGLGKVVYVRTRSNGGVK